MSAPDRIVRLAAACAALAACGPSPAAADAPPSGAALGGAAIAISQCSVGRAARSKYDGYPYTYDKGLQGMAPGGYPQQVGPVVDGLHLTYRNASGVVATRVTFTVTYGGRTRRIVDRGTFSPGVEIVRDFDAFDDAPFVGSEPQTCAVASVGFARGAASDAR